MTGYAVKRPCDDCPFRREGGVRLEVPRILQIVNAITTNPGSTFACHKTTGVMCDPPPGGQQHCAGALVFADKLERLDYPQLHRIALRLGMLRPDELRDRDAVFDDLDEMLDSAIPRVVGRRS